MHLKRFKPIDQTSDYMENLARTNGTTVSSCGYITCALVQYFAEILEFQGQLQIAKVDEKNMTPYIQKAMKSIKNNRKRQILKFKNKMTESQQKNYLRDWVASYQIVDFIDSIRDKLFNKQVYFVRQCAYDHPQAMKDVKFQESQRVKQEQQFKGQRFFFTKFVNTLQNTPKNMRKQRFCEQIKQSNKQMPIILAVDVFGHFNVMILWKGSIYIVDSLSSKENNYDDLIVEFIINSYKKSYLKE